MKFDLNLSVVRPQGFRLDVSWSGDVEALALVGPSGSGKSTLLAQMRCLYRQGFYWFLIQVFGIHDLIQYANIKRNNRNGCRGLRDNSLNH